MTAPAPDPVLDPDPVTASTVRQRIRDWWKSQLDGQTEADLKALTDRGKAELRQDPDFATRYLEETLGPVMYDIGLSLVSHAREREPAPPESTTGSGRRIVSAVRVAAAIEREPPDWSKWLEYDPLSGKHRQLLTLTREQAEAAADFRERRAAPDLHTAALLRQLITPLAPGQAIGEHWSEEAVTALGRRLVVERPKIKLLART